MTTFLITKNRIECNSGDFKDETDMVIQARDSVSKLYQKELLKGQKVIFDEWNFNKGTIDYHISTV